MLVHTRSGNQPARKLSFNSRDRPVASEKQSHSCRPFFCFNKLERLTPKTPGRIPSFSFPEKVLSSSSIFSGKLTQAGITAIPFIEFSRSERKSTSRQHLEPEPHFKHIRCGSHLLSFNPACANSCLADESIPASTHD